MKIYVASSWRNDRQPEVVQALRDAGHAVYDFRNPSETDKGFAWSDIDPNWQAWSNEQYLAALHHPIAKKGFYNDYHAMLWADACVMVMPCGRSAHLEAGWFAGANKPTVILLTDAAEPELMYKLTADVCTTLGDVIESLASVQSQQDMDFDEADIYAH